MITITGITLVNGQRRSMRTASKQFDTRAQMEVYRKRLRHVLSMRAKHDLFIDFTYKEP